MFKNLRIKWKLSILAAITMVALIIVGCSGYMGISTVGDAAREIGTVRLPSIQGLMAISEGQTAVVSATLTTAIDENIYTTQQRFADAAKLRESAWSRIDAGWKKYEPLPQTADEAVLWKQFTGEWEAWKASDAKISTIIAALAQNKDEQRQKELFVDFYREFEASRPLFSAAESTLMKICEVNDAVAKKSVDAASAAVTRANFVMLASALAAAIVAISCSAIITRAITAPIGEAVRVAQTVASGDLTSVILVESTEETGQLLLALKQMNDNLVRIVGDVREGAETIATASAQIASGNLDLSSRTEEQASSLEETASALEELTSTVRQNAENATHASKLAASAEGIAAKGGDVVSRVVGTMDAINDSSKQISEIIGVIDGIAFQTNILALNAAVEAARAGDHGRGFAVVASEVRLLAKRSADAAKEIKILIGESSSKVGAGSALVAEAGATMAEIVASVRRVTSIMSEISLASQEQSLGIDQINVAIAQMDQVTQQNAALVEEAAAAAESLQEQAVQQNNSLAMFKLSANGMNLPTLSA